MDRRLRIAGNMSADPTTNDPDLEAGDEPYDSAEDEDFELDATGQDEESEPSSDSDAEDDVGRGQPAKKKRKTGTRGKKDAGVKEDELDSGDEATIQKAKERKKKRTQKQKGQQAKGKAGGSDDEDDEEDVDFDEDEEGDTGGFVRTRAMKMRTQEERKPLAKVDGATVDVNALWEKMNASDSETVQLPTHSDRVDEAPAPEETNEQESKPEESPTPIAPRKQVKFSEETIKIKRTYKFAGEMITEEKVVPKDSAEAKIFLANGENVDAMNTADDDAKAALKLRRPLRKISRFDPNPTGSIKKSWEKQPMAEAQREAENVKGPKINTVEKSRLDWAAYVDQEGIKDELTIHSKAKEGFLGRMDFLDRVDAKKEEDRRNARLRGM